LKNPHKRILDERRRYGRFEDIEGLHPDERGIMSQNAMRNSAKMYGARRGPKKIEVNGRTYGDEISFYHRLQRADFYWPSMGKDADLVQTQCEAYHLAIDRKESYTILTNED